MDFHQLDETIVARRWAVSSAIVIKANPENVWKTISEQAHLLKTHPFVKEHKVLKWPGLDAQDYLTYNNGYTLYRTFRRWEEGQGYHLDASLGKNKTSRVIWKISSEKPGRSILSITILPFQVDHLSKIVSWIPFYFKVYPILKTYLESVLKGFKFYIETGKKVEKNQFGAHQNFSPE